MGKGSRARRSPTRNDTSIQAQFSSQSLASLDPTKFNSTDIPYAASKELVSHQHRFVSKHREGHVHDNEEEPPYFTLRTTPCHPHRSPAPSPPYAHQGYAPLNSDFDNFYIRRLKTRISDIFFRPVTGVPGRTVQVLERVSNDYNKTFTFTGRRRECLNLSSYNYLGFAQSEGPCADAVSETIRRYGLSSCSPRAEAGSLDLHVYAEELVARFVGKPVAMIVSMGFATNSTTIPSLVSKGSLIISDELNHASIVFGARLSGAFVRVFKHNDMKALEELLREVISQGQPRTHRRWRNILVMVEGLYSMEGDICKLPELIELKKKYKFQLYVDEAHSIGALGPRGRGVCDYFGVNPDNVDILMGTFTKSFGAAGGYIAASREIVDHLRCTNHSMIYAESISPPILQQIITSMTIIMGEDGTDNGRERLERLAFNSRYMHNRLRKMGFIVMGDRDSPIVPLMVYHPAKIPAVAREMLDANIAVVMAAYPATPLTLARIRFCLSAAHTKEDLDYLLSVLDNMGDRMDLKLSRKNLDKVVEEW
ncbi:serine palmitoyltransferase 2 [Endogone sp. FLAS-F59071]|nr:serine palmitoyltransferase 2 [Endogone sp. FLAS-F59071]|eukprot:RUS18290.1 serine palmitoyltransferase 2 [Endogone sp. FLAS-F59071]